MSKARHSALLLLSRREHSKLELQQKLSTRGYAAEVIDEILTALAAEGLQDDARFAESYIYSRSQQGYGPVRLREELKQRGVARDIINERLDAASEDWWERMREVRSKRFGMAMPDTYPERMRQSRFLAMRGFSMEEIGRLIRAENVD